MIGGALRRIVTFESQQQFLPSNAPYILLLIKGQKDKNIRGFNMPTIKPRSQIGRDGILHLDIPSDFKETEVNVTVTVEAVQEVSEDLASRKEERKPRYNAWGNPVVEQSITQAISGMRHLQKTVALPKSEIRAMREEGRRF